MKSGERVFATVFGAFLLGLGIYIAFFGLLEPWWNYSAAIVFVAFGVNAIYGARNEKRPWIFSIGPIP